jgi:TetR/AcrR family transcriptional regulator, transcriptional repressor for nem operon
MRVSKEKAAEHRRQIATAAARLFRERGIGATGVDSITEAADLTHGAVYSQFGSKEAITIESVRLAFKDSRRTWLRTLTRRGRKKALTAIIESYLSDAHRDSPGTGCVIAALGGEISRQPRSVRDAFTEEFKLGLEFLRELAATGDNPLNEGEALAAFASMVGALILARAVSDRTLSDQIMTDAIKWIERRV